MFRRAFPVAILLLLVGLLLLTSEHPRNDSPVGESVSPAVEKPLFPDSSAVFQNFRDWRASASPAPSVGLELAQARREVMERLIRENPEEALRQGLTQAERARLPQAIRAVVEEPFSVVGDWTMLANCGGEVPRRVEIGGQAWQATAWGDLRLRTSKRRAPMHGLRLGDWAAVAAAPWQRLTAKDRAHFGAERPEARAKSLFRGEPLSDQAIPVLVAGKVAWFASEEEIGQAESLLARLEERPDPDLGAGAVTRWLEVAGDSGGVTLQAFMEEALVQPSAWTVGTKRVAVIVAAFSDTAASVTPGTLADVFNNDVRANFAALSYGKVSLEATAIPEVITLAKPAADYLPSKVFELFDDVIAAARAAGHNPDPYDIRAVHFPGIGMVSGSSSFSGLGVVSGDRLWLQGSASSHVITHELGHNYGLRHANGWQPSGADPVGAGSSQEYGDFYDTMGGGSMPEGHFHMQGKRRLDWLEAEAVIEVTASGVYRVHRVDHPQTTGVRGLRIRKGADQAYWVGYRRNFPGEPGFHRGAYLIWQRTGDQSWIVDATPGSPAGLSDAGLRLGHTYADNTANVFITPMKQGGAGAQEYLDVRVNLGPFPGNAAPTLTLNAPSAWPARSPLIVSANAIDPDGDPLHYAWDFGDGLVSANNANVSKSFTIGGNYRVRLTVSDGKGGQVTREQAITIIDPALAMTNRATGTTEPLHGIAANEGVAVAVGFNGMTLRSTDGVSWTSHPVDRFYNLSRVVWTGDRFLAAGSYLDWRVGKFLGAVLSSPDGVTWTERFRGLSTFYGIATSGRIHLAVGRDGGIARSTDGDDWSVVPPPVNKLFQGVAWGGGVFHVVGYASFRGNVSLLRSEDGLAWTDEASRLTLSGFQDLRHIAWLNGRFVASGFQAKVLSSVDRGQTWITASMPRYYEMEALAYGNGFYYAAGSYNDGGGWMNEAMVSTDAVNWAVLPASDVPARHSACFFRRRLITVGDGGSIQSSEVMDPPPPTWDDWRQEIGEGVAPGDDPDQDGVSRLLDYATGGLKPELEEFGQTEDGRPILRLRRATRRPDVLYQVEISPDLSPGSWTSVGLSTLMETDNEWQVALPSMDNERGRHFVRFTAILAEP